MQRKHNKSLTTRAKELRKNMTPQEKKLWYEFLNSYPVRILRQKVICHYIADFYCSAAKLVIEIDGSQHYSDAANVYDEKRTAVLNDFGITVIRFSNLDIDRNFVGVCEEIDRVIRSRC